MKQTHEYYPLNGRVILHIDMNAFYCSVHEAVDPASYKEKPLAVAGSAEARKGIVVTSSYAARARGVKTGMQSREALKLCPDLILIAPDFDLYRQFSRAFMKIVYCYSPLVEAMSIDECFVDITGSKQFGTPMDIATVIQKRIMNEQMLPCSIGIAPNKLLAKMASDMKKPQGISVLRLRDVPTVLWGQPCRSLFGIGEKTANKLQKLQIYTIGQLANADEQQLNDRFGTMGTWMKQAANGIDHAAVNPIKGQSKSIGHTTTLPRNYSDIANIQRVFLNLADQVGRRLRRQKLMAETVQITIRKPDMKTITRSVTLHSLTDNADDIYREACHLFEQNWTLGDPVRLLGITLQNLRPKVDSAVQLDLFGYGHQEKKEKLNQTMDMIRDKYGESSILSAGMLEDNPAAAIRNYSERGTSLQMDHLREKGLDQED